MKYYIFLLIGAMDTTYSLAQDSVPLVKNAIIYRIKIKEQNQRVSRGYLGRITDSMLYLSASPISVNLKGVDPSILKPFDYKNISMARLERRKLGSIGKGLLIGATIGALFGVIAGGSSKIFGGERSASEKGSILGTTVGLGSFMGGIIGLTVRKTFMIHGKKERFEKMQELMTQKIYNN